MAVLWITADDRRRPPFFHAVTRFPAAVGRSPRCAVVCDGHGIWDEHLEIAAKANGSLTAAVKPPALATLNGVNLTEAILRPGDELQCGGFVLHIALAPPAQKPALLDRSLVWAVILLVTLAQAAILAALLRA
jgi:hypothetical protein